MDRDHPFGQLFEGSSDPAFIVDPFGDRILAANRAGCALLGYTRQELLARARGAVWPGVPRGLGAYHVEGVTPGPRMAPV
jgi:PAS domain S-box-containing protein